MSSVINWNCMRTVRCFMALLLLICSNANGQKIFSFQSIKSIDGKVVITGKYKDLIDNQGFPGDSLISKIGYKEYVYLNNSDSIIGYNNKIVEIVYLIYGDSLHYIKSGDSVQLAYVDFSRSDFAFDLDGVIIDGKYNFKKAKNDFMLNKNDDYYMFNEFRNRKRIRTKTFGIRTKEKYPYDDNLWFVFWRKNNKLWYVEFPLNCEGSIMK